jgi:hypothetical protein
VGTADLRLYNLVFHGDHLRLGIKIEEGGMSVPFTGWSAPNFTPMLSSLVYIYMKIRI